MKNLFKEIERNYPNELELKERLEEEFYFAFRFAVHKKKKEWKKLIYYALNKVKIGLANNANLYKIAEEAEKIIEPIGELAKEYTIHYIGHNHIDINWLWDWPETLDVIYKSFSSVDKLMDEFPNYRFSQSSAIYYAVIEKNCSELFKRIQKRVKEGRWEVIASTWVEGDKNMASGETLVRQILYAKKYFAKRFGINYRQIQIDWEPDTFGHPWTYPQIMKRAGVDYYYINRGGKEHRLFLWESPDGSQILVWNDAKYLYSNSLTMDNTRYSRKIEPKDVVEILEHENKTGMKDYIIVYGMGDHSIGPDRKQIQKIEKFSKWPIFPRVKFSTVKEYFNIAQKYREKLPVIKDELNFVFRGCYSSQSKIKYANRKLENDLIVTESIVLFAHLISKFNLNSQLEKSWQKLCFNQFHDVLPGCGIKETYEYALGIYQGAQAITLLTQEMALNAIIDCINIKGEGIPIIVFNLCAWKQTGNVNVVIYEPPQNANKFMIVDEKGNQIPFQINSSYKLMSKKFEKEGMPFCTKPTRLFFDVYHKHDYIEGCFIASEVPSYGYKTYWLSKSDSIKIKDGVKVKKSEKGILLENEFYRLQIDSQSGALTSLYDKRYSREFVSGKKKMGLLCIYNERPHENSAWKIGPINSVVNLDIDGSIEIKEEGPVRSIIQCQNKYCESNFLLKIILHKNIPMISFDLEVDWLERGGTVCGVPSLKVIFPIAITNPQPSFEIPFGNIKRQANGKEVPSLGWTDLSDNITGFGITLLNDTTYSYCANGNDLSITLLRSSYEPDPLPEIGKHNFKYSIFPHGPEWSPSMAAYYKSGFNRPFIIKRSEIHDGQLPSCCNFLTIEPMHIIVTAVKLAENSNNIIIRINEVNGKNALARIKMAWKIVEATEVDLLEQQIDGKGDDIKVDLQGHLEVKVKPYEIKTLSLKTV